MSIREPHVAHDDLVAGWLHDHPDATEPDATRPRSGGVPEPIVQVACSTAAFVGPLPAGPLHVPTEVTSVAELAPFAHRGQSTAVLESARLFFEGGGRHAVIVRTESADLDDLCGREHYREGVWALSNSDVNLLSIPDTRTMELPQADAVIRSAIEIADRLDALYLLDPPQVLGSNARDLDDWLPVTERAAAYLPYLKRRSRPTLRRDHLALSGPVAAIIARTESEQGVWKSPSGAVSEIQPKEWHVAREFEGSERTQMRRIGINLVRSGEAPIVLGSRTLMARGALNDEEKYISVMRTASMLRRSIQQGIEWAMLEPNEPAMWSQIRQQVADFMYRMWEQGAFAGSTPTTAYFVQCDESTMSVPPGGVPKILVGFAPIEPGRFIPVEVSFPTPRWFI